MKTLFFTLVLTSTMILATETPIKKMNDCEYEKALEVLASIPTETLAHVSVHYEIEKYVDVIKKLVNLVKTKDKVKREITELLEECIHQTITEECLKLEELYQNEYRNPCFSPSRIFIKKITQESKNTGAISNIINTLRKFPDKNLDFFISEISQIINRSLREYGKRWFEREKDSFKKDISLVIEWLAYKKLYSETKKLEQDLTTEIKDLSLDFIHQEKISAEATREFIKILRNKKLLNLKKLKTEITSLQYKIEKILDKNKHKELERSIAHSTKKILAQDIDDIKHKKLMLAFYKGALKQAYDDNNRLIKNNVFKHGFLKDKLLNTVIHAPSENSLVIKNDKLECSWEKTEEPNIQEEPEEEISPDEILYIY